MTGVDAAAIRADLTADDWFEQIEAECERALTDVPRHPCERCAGTGGVGLPGRLPVQCSDCEGRGELPMPQHALDYLRDRAIVAEQQRDVALAYAREMERQRNAFGEALTRIANGEAPADSAADAMQRLARFDAAR